MIEESPVVCDVPQKNKTERRIWMQEMVWQAWVDMERLLLHFSPLIFREHRHSSATYKLLESGGDVKLVQGDMGHASATVSLDTYAHTQDSRRRALTEKISKEFYGGSSVDDRQDQLMQLLDEDPEMKKKLLQALLAEDAQKQDVGKSVSSKNYKPSKS